MVGSDQTMLLQGHENLLDLKEFTAACAVAVAVAAACAVAVAVAVAVAGL